MPRPSSRLALWAAPNEETQQIIGSAGWRFGTYHAGEISSTDLENRLTHRL